MPRLRRSSPDILSFDSPEDLSNFVQEALKNSDFLYEKFSGVDDFVDGLKTFEGDSAAEIVEKSRSHIFDLIRKCDSYCPHIDRLPYVKPHFMLPGFRVLCCFDCSSDWMDSVDPNDDRCDLCDGVAPNHIFNEISIQMGPAMLSANLGDCCIGFFR